MGLATGDGIPCLLWLIRTPELHSFKDYQLKTYINCNGFTRKKNPPKPLKLSLKQLNQHLHPVKMS